MPRSPRATKYKPGDFVVCKYNNMEYIIDGYTKDKVPGYRLVYYYDAGSSGGVWGGTFEYARSGTKDNGFYDDEVTNNGDWNAEDTAAWLDKRYEASL